MHKYVYLLSQTLYDQVIIMFIHDAVQIPCVPGVVIKPCDLNYKSKPSLDLKPRVPP